MYDIYFINSLQPSTKKMLSLNPPSPQRQPLQLQRRRLNEAPKRHNPNNNTQHIDNIIPIPLNRTSPTAIQTPMLLVFQNTAERSRDQLAFHGRYILRRGRRRDTCRFGEEVDELEDEEAGKCAA